MVLLSHVSDPSFVFEILVFLTWSKPVPNHEELQRNGNNERDVLSNSSDREDGSDGNWTGKHKRTQHTPDRYNEPDCVDGGSCVLVDFLEPTRSREGSVARVCVDNTR